MAKAIEFRSIANIPIGRIEQLIHEFHDDLDLLPRLVPGVEKVELRDFSDSDDVVRYRLIVHVRYRIFSGTFTADATVQKMRQVSLSATKRGIGIVDAALAIEPLGPNQTIFNTTMNVGREFGFLNGVIASRFHTIVDPALRVLERSLSPV